MKITFTVSVLILGLWWIGCDFSRSGNPANEELVASTDSSANDSYELNQYIDRVYEALLKLHVVKPGGGHDVVLDETVWCEQFDFTRVGDIFAADEKNTNEMLASDLKSDFLKNSIECRPMSIPSELRNRFVTVSKSDLESLFAGKKGWGEFYRRFPQASLIEFSAVGFNYEKTEALVYMSETSGLRTGEGNFYLLIRTKENWLVKRKINAWLS
jgi:hypothetical protein